MSKAVTLVFFAFIQVIIYLANTGYNCPAFDYVRGLPYGDKLTHFALFGLLTLVLNFALKFEIFSIVRFKVYIGTIAVAVFVLLEEFSQMLFPARSFDVNDLVADSVGIVFFTILTYAAGRTQCRQNSRKTALIRLHSLRQYPF